MEKFTAVQQLALFSPDIEITIDRMGEFSPFYQASATYRGETITAVQQGKKKAKQAICSKIIRVRTTQGSNYIYHQSFFYRNFVC